MLYQRRHVVDDSLRAMLAQKPNVEFRWGVRVKALRDGPVVETADGDLQADFVVDASGRHSRLCADYMSSCDETLIDLQYSAMEFELTNDDDARFGVCVFPKAGMPRGACVFRLERNRVLATAFGYQDARPRDIDTAEAWLQFARSVAKPDVADFLATATPVTKPHTFLYDKVSKRHFKYMPASIIAIGDAACSTDPCFGQGMTKAAIQALLVKRVFEAGKATCRQSDFEWVSNMPHLMGCVEAFRHPKTSGYGPPMIGLLQTVFDMGFYAASKDSVVYDEILRVYHMHMHPVWMIFTVPRVLMRCFIGMALCD